MKYLLLLFLFLFSSHVTNAAVHINELYPAPLTSDSEWVELYNDENLSIGLTAYTLKDLSNNTIPLPATIGPLQYVTIQINNILNNDGESVFLRNNNVIIESVTYTTSFTSTKSYARCPDGTGNWITTTLLTKNISNSSACIAATPTPTNTPIPTPSPTPTAVPTNTPTPSATPTIAPTPTFSPSPTPSIVPTILITEVYPNPQTGESEWIELYNAGDTSADLNNWLIDDIEDAGSSPKPINLIIASHAYGVISLTSSIFNNTEDWVRLLDQDETAHSQFHYETTQKGMSWGLSPEGYFCLQNPTKGVVNNVGCLQHSNTSTTTEALPTPTSFPIHSPSPAPVTQSKLDATIPRSTVTPSFIRQMSNIKPSIAIVSPTSKPSQQPEVLGEQTHNTPESSSPDTARPLSLLSLASALSAAGIMIFKILHIPQFSV